MADPWLFDPLEPQDNQSMQAEMRNGTFHHRTNRGPRSEPPQKQPGLPWPEQDDARAQQANTHSDPIRGSGLDGINRP